MMSRILADDEPARRTQDGGAAVPELGFLISDIARLIQREADRKMAGHASTGAQWRLLAWIRRLGDGPRQIELAEKLDLDPITVSRAIDRLLARGFAERRRDAEDRRAWRIYLTPKAIPVLEDLGAIAQRLDRRLLAGIPKADRETVLRVLRSVRQNICRSRSG